MVFHLYGDIQCFVIAFRNPLILKSCWPPLAILGTESPFCSVFWWWSISRFPSMGNPKHGWFIVENLVRMNDLGVPPFMETPKYNHLIYRPWELFPGSSLSLCLSHATALWWGALPPGFCTASTVKVEKQRVGRWGASNQTSKISGWWIDFPKTQQEPIYLFGFCHETSVFLACPFLQPIQWFIPLGEDIIKLHFQVRSKLILLAPPITR